MRSFNASHALTRIGMSVSITFDAASTKPIRHLPLIIPFRFRIRIQSPIRLIRILVRIPAQVMDFRAVVTTGLGTVAAMAEDSREAVMDPDMVAAMVRITEI